MVFVGLDLGQVSDYSALVSLRRELPEDLTPEEPLTVDELRALCADTPASGFAAQFTDEGGFRYGPLEN